MFQNRNDSNKIVIACPNSSTHVCWCSSLSRGAWNRAIFARYYDNHHFEHFDKSVNLVSWLTLLSKCSKWWLSKKGGLVAEGCLLINRVVISTETSSVLFMLCSRQDTSAGSFMLRFRHTHNLDVSCCDLDISICIVLNFMLPKRRFWTAEQSVACAFLNEFSVSCSPKRVLTPLKSASKTHTQRFVQSFKNFVWGA